MSYIQTGYSVKSSMRQLPPVVQTGVALQNLSYVRNDFYNYTSFKNIAPQAYLNRLKIWQKTYGEFITEHATTEPDTNLHKQAMVRNIANILQPVEKTTPQNPDHIISALARYLDTAKYDLVLACRVPMLLP